MASYSSGNRDLHAVQDGQKWRGQVRPEATPSGESLHDGLIEQGLYLQVDEWRATHRIQAETTEISDKQSG